MLPALEDVFVVRTLLETKTNYITCTLLESLVPVEGPQSQGFGTDIPVWTRSVWTTQLAPTCTGKVYFETYQSTGYMSFQP